MRWSASLKCPDMRWSTSVAVMRKLLLLANALLRQNRLWTPRAGDEPTAAPAEAAEEAGQPPARAASAGGQPPHGPGDPLPAPA